MTNQEKLAEYKDVPLRYKIILAQARIDEAVAQYDEGCTLSFSGGKDSLVLLDIARNSLRLADSVVFPDQKTGMKMYPNMKAIFFDTGLEFPEIRNFVKKFDNVEWLKPKMLFKKVLEKYGVPVISKSVSMAISRMRSAERRGVMEQFDIRLFGGVNPTSGRKQTVGVIPQKWHDLAINGKFKISEQCCDKLKKDPAKDYHKKNGGVMLIGTMASDSHNRKLDYYKHGCNAFDKKIPQSRPLMMWTEEDIWQYINASVWDHVKCYGRNNKAYPSWWMGMPEWYVRLYYKIFRKKHKQELRLLEYSKIYDMGYGRTGCAFCLFGIEKDRNRIVNLKKTHPKIYNFCMDKLGYAKILDAIKIPY